jgi:PhzF family phenazine biosynthesis protein
MRPFREVDVFGAEPLAGNPLAVVHDAEGLSTEEMQSFARWTNLSETTFLLTPDDPEADYRVRIFTLVGELPFAGHPTLGSCHAWLEAGGIPRGDDVVQECGAGLVRLRRREDGLAFGAPPVLRGGPVEEAMLLDVAAVLGIARDDIVASAWVDNGPGWVGVRLADAEAVLALRPSGRVGELATEIGVVGLRAPGSPTAYEVRALFADEHGNLREDPVTGSLNASVAQWLLGEGLVEAPYTATQGVCIGRCGHVRIDQDDDGQVWVAGSTRTLILGQVELGA